MAFTLVTIFFLPLGFLAAFFGMNNEQINQASWMSLDEQMKYMFGLSTAVTVFSISVAFSPWTRATLTALFKIPILFVLEYTGMRRWWKYHMVGHGYFEEISRERIEWIYGHGERVDRKRKAAEKAAAEKMENERAYGKDQRATVKLVDMFFHGERSQAVNKSSSLLNRRTRVDGANIGGLAGNGIPDGNGLEVEKGQRIVIEDER